MISRLFETDDPVTRSDLERIHTLLENDIFLKGLGVNANDCLVPDDFPLVADIATAKEFILPQDLWDLPEPWPYQDFVGVVEEEAGRLYYRTGIPEDRRKEIKELSGRNTREFEPYLLDIIDFSYQRHHIDEYLREHGRSGPIDEKKFDHIVHGVFQNNIHGFIWYIIKAAYYGGLDNSPIFKRMLEAFETGGTPCGWLGPLPEDGGNDPIKAVTLLHFGQPSVTWLGSGRRDRKRRAVAAFLPSDIEC